MASLGQILRLILRGQRVQQAFMQAKPSPGLKQQTLIGAARGKTGPGLALPAPKVQVKIEELLWITAVLANIVKGSKTSTFNLTGAVSGMQTTLGDIRASEKAAGQLAQDLASANGIETYLRQLDELIDLTQRQLAAAVTAMESKFQLLDSALKEPASKPGIGRTIA